MSAALPLGIWIASSAKRSVQQNFLNLANVLNRPAETGEFGTEGDDSQIVSRRSQCKLSYGPLGE